MDAENFHGAPGINLYRGLSNFRHVAENLNGYWVGTGFMSDGNHYAGESAKSEAIEDFGFSRTWGWAMLYKLSPDARITELAPVESMTLQRFITEVRRHHDADPSDLQAIHQDARQVGLRAVLLNHHMMVNSEEDHYVVYNNDTLVYSEAFTPQAFGLPQATNSASADAQHDAVSQTHRTSSIDSDNRLAKKIPVRAGQGAGALRGGNTMTTGHIKARKSQLLAYIKYTPAFERDYRDFEHHDIQQILDEFERRDPVGYRLCVDRMDIHGLRRRFRYSDFR